jgi:hypothetical protein
MCAPADPEPLKAEEIAGLQNDVVAVPRRAAWTWTGGGGSGLGNRSDVSVVHP